MSLNDLLTTAMLEPESSAVMLYQINNNPYIPGEDSLLLIDKVQNMMLNVVNREELKWLTESMETVSSELAEASRKISQLTTEYDKKIIAVAQEANADYAALAADVSAIAERLRLCETKPTDESLTDDIVASIKTMSLTTEQALRELAGDVSETSVGMALSDKKISDLSSKVTVEINSVNDEVSLLKTELSNELTVERQARAKETADLLENISESISAINTDRLSEDMKLRKLVSDLSSENENDLEILSAKHMKLEQAMLVRMKKVELGLLAVSDKLEDETTIASGYTALGESFVARDIEAGLQLLDILPGQAYGLTQGILFAADNVGAAGNVSLVFDGIQTVSAVVSDFNIANPSNTVSTDGSTQVLSAETLVLSGGE